MSREGWKGSELLEFISGSQEAASLPERFSSLAGLKGVKSGSIMCDWVFRALRKWLWL